MLFRDVIGQEEVKKQLVEMVEQNRLSHALLFLGREGGGALSLAMAFAQYISLLPAKSASPSEASLFSDPAEIRLPRSAEESDTWMEKQASFRKATGMVHPDIHFS